MLKWAGGKRWLISEYRHLFPTHVDRLIEPFAGSAAVFFELCPDTAILGDSNPWLIDTYVAVKRNWRKVYEYLERHHRLHSRGHYYKVRSEKPRSFYAQAANFIYLNRTCWNGLYRLSRTGEFNVPIGNRNSVIHDDDDFELFAERLQCTSLLKQDFGSTIALARKGDVIYADPPYIAHHENNGFVEYNEHLFTWQDQIRLRDRLRSAAERGCAIIASNAYHASIKELYVDWANLETLKRQSSISGAVSGRGACKEYLITAP